MRWVLYTGRWGALQYGYMPKSGFGVILNMCEIGQSSPENGRYRCAICGAEIHVETGETFPACPSKDHSPRWVLCEELILSMASAGR